jgi:hypothetical protein
MSLSNDDVDDNVLVEMTQETQMSETQVTTTTTPPPRSTTQGQQDDDEDDDKTGHLGSFWQVEGWDPGE